MLSFGLAIGSWLVLLIWFKLVLHFNAERYRVNWLVRLHKKCFKRFSFWSFVDFCDGVAIFSLILGLGIATTLTLLAFF